MAGVEAHINVFIIPRQMSIHTTIHSPVYITTAYCLFYPLFELRSLQCCPPLKRIQKIFRLFSFQTKAKRLLTFQLSVHFRLLKKFPHHLYILRSLFLVYSLFVFLFSFFFFLYFYSVWMMLLFDVFVSAFFCIINIVYSTISCWCSLSLSLPSLKQLTHYLSTIRIHMYMYKLV